MHIIINHIISLVLSLSFIFPFIFINTIFNIISIDPISLIITVMILYSLILIFGESIK